MYKHICIYDSNIGLSTSWFYSKDFDINLIVAKMSSAGLMIEHENIPRSKYIPKLYRSYSNTPFILKNMLYFSNIFISYVSSNGS